MDEFDTTYRPGRHLLQVPGPTNVPASVLAAIARPTIDHRGPEFAALTLELLTEVRRVFATTQPVVLFAGSGTGAWEAALANTCSPGDHVLLAQTGQFSTLWGRLAGQIGLVVEELPNDWRHPVDPDAIAEVLRRDTGGQIKGVLVVHNETSTGVTSDVAAVRRAIDDAGHPALLYVDAVSALGSIDFRMDEWGVDVTIVGSQKGLMLPPGLCFNAVSERALAAAKLATLPRAYFDWQPVLESNQQGMFPYTPPTNLFFGLKAALGLLFAEGLENVFARHRRHGAAARAAVEHWGLELQCAVPAAASPTVTAVRVPDGHREQDLRAIAHDRFALALGAGLGELAGRVFRIGHLGDFDDLSLVATIAGIELALGESTIPYRPGGVQAAVEALRTAA